MPVVTSLIAALAGLGFGLSLIVAIGAQNAYVLRQGLRREHVTAVVVFCALSDAVLIALGVAGIGALHDGASWVLVVLRIVGIVFLLSYALIAVRRAVRPGAINADASGSSTTMWSSVATVAALTWLNPHVYLDTLVLLGSVAATYGAQRWFFGLGAALGSLVWFSALGYGARLLRPVFARPIAWRVLDLSIAVVMATLAVSLLVGLLRG